MIDGSMLAARTPRAPQTKPAADAATGAASDAGTSDDAQAHALALAKSAFNYKSNSRPKTSANAPPSNSSCWPNSKMKTRS